MDHHQHPVEDERRFTGHVAVGPGGQKIGTVTDVIEAPEGDHADWLVVETGLLRTEHVVPARGTYTSEDGRVVVPFGRTEVRHAPKPNREHVLTPEMQRELVDHYEARA